MAYFSLQTPAGQYEHDGRNAQSLGSQRSHLADSRNSPDSEPQWVHQASNTCSAAPTQVLPVPTGRLEDYFVLDSHVLGSGQFGTVRRCTERATGSRFACKTLLKDRLSTEAERDEIRREIELMQRVAVGGAHTGIVQLRAVFEDDVAVHLVMELCEGGELFDEVVRRGRFNERDAASVFAQVASAVAHCHARGVLHRDLKPENILLVRDPSVPLCAAPLTTKVADFGLGVSLVAGERAKGVAGSPFYIAPEVLTGDYSLGADVWSLGVILYILLSGVPPFWGATDKDVFVEVLRGAVDMSGPEWSGVSEEAKHLVRCLLQRDPARRPSAAAILSHPWILRSCHVSNAGARHVAVPTKSDAADAIMA
ncbi:hypothetical protein CLOM_g7164 [Closterium sp. NIES-68]|nr:hypothetical protein CLOM_g7164 [Closterium sp. NIES-68]GJP78968.1 hypothetical protein CLOP_g9225 [Closterium sp. NIES-67]